MDLLFKKGLLIDSLYKGGWKDGKRDGFGWQVYLNGFIHIGYWNKDKANGFGLFIHNNGTFVRGLFKNNNISDGYVQFNSKAFYYGSFEENTEEFKEGTFQFSNDTAFKGKWENGNPVSGIFQLKKNEDDSQDEDDGLVFNFNGSGPGSEFVIKGIKGVILKKDTKEMVEGIVINGERCGQCYSYSSPREYYTGDFKKNEVCGQINLMNINNSTQETIIKNGSYEKQFEKTFFCGINVIRREEQSDDRNYLCTAKYLSRDIIKPYTPLTEHNLFDEEFLVNGVRYIYTNQLMESQTLELDNFFRIQNVEQLKERITFERVLESIYNENSEIKMIVLNHFNTFFQNEKKYFFDDELKDERERLDNELQNCVEDLQEDDSSVPLDKPRQERLFIPNKFTLKQFNILSQKVSDKEACFDKDIRLFKGTIKDGKFEGECEIEKYNNDTYKGNFVNGKKEGIFVIRKNGETVKKLFKNDSETATVGNSHETKERKRFESDNYQVQYDLVNGKLEQNGNNFALKKRDSAEFLKGDLILKEDKADCVFVSQKNGRFSIDFVNKRVKQAKDSDKEAN